MRLRLCWGWWLGRFSHFKGLVSMYEFRSYRVMRKRPIIVIIKPLGFV